MRTVRANFNLMDAYGKLTVLSHNFADAQVGERVELIDSDGELTAAGIVQRSSEPRLVSIRVIDGTIRANLP